jgi:hypothetical protein
MEHWFVYYKLPADEIDPCVRQVRAMQQALAAATGARVRLMRRADEAGATATLMEVYSEIADGAAFGNALSAALDRGHTPGAVGAARRIERFVEV